MSISTTIIIAILLGIPLAFPIGLAREGYYRDRRAGRRYARRMAILGYLHTHGTSSSYAMAARLGMGPTAYYPTLHALWEEGLVHAWFDPPRNSSLERPPMVINSLNPPPVDADVISR